jgi:tetratricopeptide (TPR) repeat protein
MLEPSPGFHDRSEQPRSLDLNAASAHGERPFVGRAAELAALREGLDAAIAGEGRTFLISGESGIGKTRLAWELTGEAGARGARVDWGRCWESGGAPAYWPWIEVIRQMAASNALPHTIELGRRGLHLAQIVPDLAERLGVSDIAPPTPTDPESARFLVFDAIAAFLREVSDRRPQVIVIDDLHAADHASQLLLVFLARTLIDCGVLLVGTHRDPGIGHESDGPLAELCRHARRLSLRGLAMREVGRLIEHTALVAPSTALLARIHSVTDGNPFFVDEILRLLCTKGLSVVEPGTIPLGIPDGVRGAVKRRLAPLSRESTDLLEIAAVIGREFDSSVLRIAAGLDLVSMLEALEDPIRHGLVIELPRAPSRFQFRHALIREVLYDGLSPAVRLSEHKRVGEALASLSDAAPGRYVAELAHHFLAAAPCADGDRFVEHGIRAARQAMARFAFEEAATLYERIIDALPYAPPDERRRCELLLALGEAKEWTNDAGGSRAKFEEAASIARRLHATDLLVRAALGIGGMEAQKAASSRCDAAPELIREALERIAPDDAVSRARLLSRLALHLMSVGSRADAIALTEKAVLLARASQDLETLGQSLIARHAVLFGPDWLDERWAIANEVLQIAENTSVRYFAMRGLALRIAILFETGDLAATDVALEVHQRLAEEASDPFERWANLVWRATRVLLAGRFERAEELSRRAFDLVQSAPGPHSSELYGPAIFAGQSMLINDALGRAVPNPDVAMHYGSRFPEISTWRIAVLAGLIREGRIKDVRRALEPIAARGFADIERNAFWIATMSYLSEAIELVGDHERAAILYPALEPYAQRNVTISGAGCRGSVAHYLGLLAATMQCFDAAAIHFENAITKNREMGALPHVALASYDYARLLARQDTAEQRTKAAELVAEAHAISIELGMKGVSAKAAELASLLRGRSSQLEETFSMTHKISLEKAGRLWIVAHAAERIHLQDAKGLVYIAELLRNPGREIHALDLLAVACGTGNVESSHPTRRFAGSADEVLDAKARHAYQRRVAELGAEIDAAAACGDPERALMLHEDLTALRRELARATGLRGRGRRSSDAERARISVTRAIHLALTRVAEATPVLGEKLARNIRTGTFCVYLAERTEQ